MYQLLNLRKEREQILKGFSNTIENRCIPYQYRLENGNNCEYFPETFDSWKLKMPEICLYMSTECKGSNHFFGQENKGQMSWTDILILDLILTNEKNIKNFIEFGTLGGEISLYLGMISKMRNGNFLTFDGFDRRTINIQNIWFHKNMKFIEEENLYNNLTLSKKFLLEKEKDSMKLFSNKDTMILFDGFKCKEIEVYLKDFKGSIFLTKDWDPLDYDCISKYLDEFDFSEIFENLVESSGSKLKAFKRILPQKN